MSLMATTISSSRWRANSVRKTSLPMRPKPLIAIFVVISSPSDAALQVGDQIKIAIAKLIGTTKILFRGGSLREKSDFFRVGKVFLLQADHVFAGDPIRGSFDR